MRDWILPLLAIGLLHVFPVHGRVREASCDLRVSASRGGGGIAVTLVGAGGAGGGFDVAAVVAEMAAVVGAASVGAAAAVVDGQSPEAVAWSGRCYLLRDSMRIRDVDSAWMADWQYLPHHDFHGLMCRCACYCLSLEGGQRRRAVRPLAPPSRNTWHAFWCSPCTQ